MEPLTEVHVGGWTLAVDGQGGIRSLRRGDLELVAADLTDGRPEIVLGKHWLPAGAPAAAGRDGEELVYEYALPTAPAVRLRHHLALVEVPGGGVALQQRLVTAHEGSLGTTLRVLLPRALRLPGERRLFVPRHDGVGETRPLVGHPDEHEFIYRFAGGVASGTYADTRLAIPLVDEYGDDELRLATITDIGFSTYYRPVVGGRRGELNWVYPPGLGVADAGERTIWTVLHTGGAEGALAAFYATALADIAPAPEWTHRIAMVDYDYFSDNGEGWFRDIDALAAALPREQREQVALCLHGWYGYIGDYGGFDPATGRFAREWLAMPAGGEPRVRALADPDGPHLLHGYRIPPRSVEHLRPVPVSVEDLQRRLRYARERGFRAILYFADGLNATVEDPAQAPEDEVLYRGGWNGPDARAHTYCQSPLHPRVREYFLAYAEALLRDLGDDLDGLTWDETYQVEVGNMGTRALPGYGSRAMLGLVKEIAARCMRRGIPFFTADQLGFFADTAPYCLVAQGIFQDSWFRPRAWPYTLFPNHRNVVWGCNWAPVTDLHWTEYGAETFDIPVAISNGCFGDDLGFSELPAELQARILDLFARRRVREQRFGWIEAAPGGLTYQGRPVRLAPAEGESVTRGRAYTLEALEV